MKKFTSLSGFLIIILMPIFINGIENSMALSRCVDMVKLIIIMIIIKIIKLLIKNLIFAIITVPQRYRLHVEPIHQPCHPIYHLHLKKGN